MDKSVSDWRSTLSLMSMFEPICCFNSLLICTHVATTCFLTAMETFCLPLLQLGKCRAYSQSCSQRKTRQQQWMCKPAGTSIINNRNTCNLSNTSALKYCYYVIVKSPGPGDINVLQKCASGFMTFLIAFSIQPTVSTRSWIDRNNPPAVLVQIKSKSMKQTLRLSAHSL